MSGTECGRLAARLALLHARWIVGHTSPLIEPDGSMEGATDEQAYDNRVRALEDELSVSTSDAQAMVDVEDVQGDSAPKNAAQHHGPNAQSETIHAHRLLAVTSQAD